MTIRRSNISNAIDIDDKLPDTNPNIPLLYADTDTIIGTELGTQTHTNLGITRQRQTQQQKK